jgi:hypothetical protein
MDCRDSLKIAVPGAFHMSSAVIKLINAMQGLDLPPPVPIATAWIIMKTVILSTDYREDAKFFFLLTNELFLFSVETTFFTFYFSYLKPH